VVPPHLEGALWEYDWFAQGGGTSDTSRSTNSSEPSSCAANPHLTTLVTRSFRRGSSAALYLMPLVHTQKIQVCGREGVAPLERALKLHAGIVLST